MKVIERACGGRLRDEVGARRILLSSFLSQLLPGLKQVFETAIGEPRELVPAICVSCEQSGWIEHARRPLDSNRVPYGTAGQSCS
jgi:nitrate/nitrite transporter NarK